MVNNSSFKLLLALQKKLFFIFSFILRTIIIIYKKRNIKRFCVKTKLLYYTFKRYLTVCDFVLYLYSLKNFSLSSK